MNIAFLMLFLPLLVAGCCKHIDLWPFNSVDHIVVKKADPKLEHYQPELTEDCAEWVSGDRYVWWPTRDDGNCYPADKPLNPPKCSDTKDTDLGYENCTYDPFTDR